MSGFTVAREAPLGSKVRIIVRKRLKDRCRNIGEVQRSDKSVNDVAVGN